MTDNDDNDNGADRAPYDLLMEPAHERDLPTADDGEERARLLFFQEAVMEMSNLIGGFFPQSSDKDIIDNVIRALNEQAALAPVIADATNYKASAGDLPGWGVQVGPIKGISNPASIIVPKLTADVMGMQTAMHWATVLAFVQSPGARVALRLMGYEIKFVQTAKVPGALVRG